MYPLSERRQWVLNDRNNSETNSKCEVCQPLWSIFFKHAFWVTTAVPFTSMVAHCQIGVCPETLFIHTFHTQWQHAIVTSSKLPLVYAKRRTVCVCLCIHVWVHVHFVWGGYWQYTDRVLIIQLAGGWGLSGCGGSHSTEEWWDNQTDKGGERRACVRGRGRWQ